MKHYIKLFISLFLSLVIVFAVCFILSTSVYAASNASEITKYCSFNASSNNNNFKYAKDNSYKTEWVSGNTASRHVDITVSSSHQIGGIYLLWDRMPRKWELQAKESDNSWTKVNGNAQEVYLIQYIRVPEQYKSYKNFRLLMTPASTSSAVNIAEIDIYTPGEPPYFAPEWQPLERVDLLTIVSHPDDEDLYMGVPPPTYTDQGYDCATVYMTYGDNSSSIRRYEALESAWSLGNKCYPTRGNFKDIKRTTKEEMMKYWPLDDTIGFIVEQIRKYKPSVIVTHDINGEYGHGAHKLTMYATSLAYKYAGDPNRYPSSAEKYGTWQAGKLYIHLYGSNKLNTMSLTTKLNSFGGRTVLKVVDDAYVRHDSQLPGRSLPVDGAYDMRKFGLYDTNLGQDSSHDSMFENVSNQAMLNLNPWYLYYMVDRSALELALSSAKLKLEEQYTPESWVEANLSVIIGAAQAVFDNRDATQEQVDEQTVLLNEAIGKLKAFLTSIEIINEPEKLIYFTDEVLDITGLIADALYSDGSRKTITVSDENISGYDSTLPAGAQEVIVSYNEDSIEKSDSYLVDILPADGEKIQSEIYVVDSDNRLIKRIYPHTSPEEFYNNFLNNPENFTLYGPDREVFSCENVASGTVCKLVVDDVLTDIMTLSVLADVNGDGEVSIVDYTMVRLHILEIKSIGRDFIDSADINNDGNISIVDYTFIRLDILCLKKIEQQAS